jgi:hypothetical protein
MRCCAAAAVTCLLAARAAAVEPATAVESSLPSPASRPFFFHANLALNAYTYFGATAAAPSLSVTPADRVITFQQIGVGYFIDPSLRVQLTLQFGETWSGLPGGASRFTLACAIPWFVWVHGGLFAGAGPILAARSGGKDQLDVGLFTAVGYAFPIGRGFTLGAALQAPMLFAVRFSVAVTPAVMLAYRF